MSHENARRRAREGVRLATIQSRAPWRRALTSLLVALVLAGASVGQESKKADAPKASPPAPEAKAVESKPAADPAPPAPGPRAEPAPADATEPAPADVSFLRYCWDASPVFFIGMGLLSLYFVAVVVDHFLKLRLAVVIPTQTLQGVDGLLNEKKYKEAYEALRGDKSLFARAVTAGVERLSHGIDRGMDAMLGVAEDGKMDMEHRASIIATIGQISPMIGLLGTVLGMVLAFQEIARGGQPKPAELANSIGLALVTTLEGLILAIPAIYFFGLFRNRISRLIFEVETLGETYLWRFAGAVKK